MLSVLLRCRSRTRKWTYPRSPPSVGLKLISSTSLVSVSACGSASPSVEVDSEDLPSGGFHDITLGASSRKVLREDPTLDSWNPHKCPLDLVGSQHVISVETGYPEQAV